VSPGGDVTSEIAPGAEHGSLSRIIHEPRLPQMQGAAYEAVVLPPRMRCNKADAVRSACPSGEK
jgi:hypothetical protein